MAIVKFSGLVTSIKGKIGGTVFQGGRAAAQVHNLGRPIYRQTPTVSAIRNKMGYISNLWKSITDAQRILWNSYASGLTWYNRFGDPYTPNGFLAFSQANYNILLCELGAPISAPGTPAALPTVASFGLNLTISPIGVSLNWSYFAGSLDWYVVPYVLPLCTPGNDQSYKHAILITEAEPVDQLTIDLSAWYQARYSDTAYSAQQVDVRYRLVNAITGEATALTTLSDIAP